jgi:putative restriction endonuclease
MKFDKKLLHYFVTDALGPYSENFRITDRQNPERFRLNSRRYSVLVSYVHDSGNARSNSDEVRIQMSRAQIEKQRECSEQGDHVAFIGFFPGGKAFVAWDPRHVFSLEARTVVSVYARQSQLAIVESNQAAAHSFDAKFLNETSLAISLPSRFLGFYLENIQRFHQLPNERSVQELIGRSVDNFDDSKMGGSGEIADSSNGKREKFTFERTAYPRDAVFTRSVLAAYGQTCCICDRQLGLVQAAHIIPHAEDDSPNVVQNGLAMCVEHHKLYDDALLLPGPKQVLYFNEQRAEFLREINQGKGLDAIKSLAGKKFRLPDEESANPDDGFLQRGLDLRMG